MIYHVHVNKCAGRSVRRALGYPDWKAAPHRTAKELQEAHEDAMPNNMVAVVRNPFDRVLSMWCYRAKGKQIDDSTSFQDFVTENWRGGGRDINDERYFKPAWWWITDNDKLLVRHVLRFENLEAEWQMFMRSFPSARPLTHENQTKHPHYVQMYDARMRDIIYEAFADDFRHFGYQW